MAVPSPLERLTGQPELFLFDAAYRLLRLSGPLGEDGVRFSAALSLAPPLAEVTAAQAAVEDKPARLTTPLMGLAGPSGVMPRWYGELLAQAVRRGNRERALIDFFDLLAQRLLAAFAAAGAKYRLARAAEDAQQKGERDAIGAALLAIAGFDSQKLAATVSAAPSTLQHYAGFFTAGPRSAARLGALLTDFLGRPVEICEFEGAWAPLAPEDWSRLPKGLNPGAHNRLGGGAALGTRSWNQQAGFKIRIGPLSAAEFQNLQPEGAAMRDLMSLVQAYTGWAMDVSIELLLKSADIPMMQLGGSRLGWNSWLRRNSSDVHDRNKISPVSLGAGSK
jgi:type VI secretion system protein ImpH